MQHSTQLTEAHQQLAQMERKYSESPLKAGEMEADLQRFLQLVRQSEGDRDGFVCMFSKIVTGARGAPEWLVAYCMHALRWPEVLAVAENEVRRGHPATLSVASEVVDAYSDDWFGRDLFDRFAHG